MSAPLRVHVGTEVWRYDDGRVLVGGAPLRVMRVPSAVGGVTAFEATGAASARVAERLRDAGLAHPDPAELPEIPRSGLTVVVPAYGRAEPVERLLSGLGGLRTIVVDDATPAPASDDLARAARRHGAELIVLPRNVGPASARNAGLARVRTPFVAFVDSDVVVDADALGLLLRHFADPGLALVAPRIVGAHGRGWISRYESARSSVDLGARPALVRPRSPVSWVSSSCLVARREALGTGFTAGRRVAEDVDLVWRLDAAGQRVRYEPRVRAAHAHRDRLRPWFARKLFYGTGAADLAVDHPRAIPPAILRLWSVGVLAALIAGRRWSPAAAGAISLAAAWRLRRRLPEAMGDRTGLALRLVGGGVVSAVSQLSALALRHWWPVAVAACLVSRRARLIVAALAVADAELERRRTGSDLDPLRFLLARRLDDLAYGAGVWVGCLRHRSARALLIELRPRFR